jgi:ArsR family transcriptional regulator, arsenate/arsenite/antimonite-responsive transcriptional repressor
MSCYNIFVMAKRNDFDAELFFAALADRTRLRLLNLMRDCEVCVCFLADTLGTNDPKISRHLAYLKRAGLVASRRDGKWMHYSIRPPQNPHAREILTATLAMFRSDKSMENDRKRLLKVCCSASAAPVPITRRDVSVART